MDRSNIDKIAQTADDRMLLAKVWDKIQMGIRKNIPANTSFLSLRELDMTHYLFGQAQGLYSFGGYEDAERKMLVFLPEYLEKNYLTGDDSPIVCLRASFYEGDTPTHRDFLGALMGAGIAREAVGDICVGNGYCDFFVTGEIAPYIQQNFFSAGRTKVQIKPISLLEVSVPQPETKEIRDTVSSLRLDSIISSGFRLSRNAAAGYIAAGKAAIDGLPCEKPDKIVAEGAKISVRGLGKIQLITVGGQTKKGRISITINRYI